MAAFRVSSFLPKMLKINVPEEQSIYFARTHTHTHEVWVKNRGNLRVLWTGRSSDLLWRREVMNEICTGRRNGPKSIAGTLIKRKHAAGPVGT